MEKHIGTATASHRRALRYQVSLTESSWLKVMRWQNYVFKHDDVIKGTILTENTFAEQDPKKINKCILKLDYGIN